MKPYSHTRFGRVTKSQDGEHIWPIKWKLLKPLDILLVKHGLGGSPKLLPLCIWIISVKLHFENSFDCCGIFFVTIDIGICFVNVIFVASDSYLFNG